MLGKRSQSNHRDAFSPEQTAQHRANWRVSISPAAASTSHPAFGKQHPTWKRCSSRATFILDQAVSYSPQMLFCLLPSEVTISSLIFPFPCDQQRRKAKGRISLDTTSSHPWDGWVPLGAVAQPMHRPSFLSTLCPATSPLLSPQEAAQSFSC